MPRAKKKKAKVKLVKVLPAEDGHIVELKVLGAPPPPDDPIPAEPIEPAAEPSAWAKWLKSLW